MARHLMFKDGSCGDSQNTQEGKFMNIDFHYGVIYVVARWAGMEAGDAEIVAHACQYIDDSTVSGVLEFKGGQTYERFAAAHGMVDYRNFLQISDKLVWSTFHFLPGGEGNSFEEKCVCKPNSDIAKEMVRRGIHDRTAGNAMHRLGVTLHTYVDTWAHQNFSGIISDWNVVHELRSDDCAPAEWRQQLTAFIEREYDTVEGDVIDLVSKVGHGAALHFPDLPWAKWSYRNAIGREIERDNLPIFLDAANFACRAIQAFMKGCDELELQSGLSSAQQESLRLVLEKSRDHDPVKRLSVLGAALERGEFCDLSEQLPDYIGKGPGSWKASAVGVTARGPVEEQAQERVQKPEWTETFEQSDYRKYHDAVQQHRQAVTREVLPKFGIRLA